MSKDFELDTRLMDELISTNPDQLDDWLGKVAFEMEGDIKLSFGTSPAGRSYQHGSVTHVASVEGYPPNVDTGALRASLHVVRDRKLRWRVSDGVEYGVYQELIYNRAFVSPVFAKWAQSKIYDFARATMGWLK